MASNAYGQMLADPQSYQEMLDLQRRQALAKALTEQSMTPIDPMQSSGRYIVPVSPWQGLAKLGQAFAGNMLSSRANKDEGAIAARQQQALSNAIAKANSGNELSGAEIQTLQVGAPEVLKSYSELKNAGPLEEARAGAAAKFAAPTERSDGQFKWEVNRQGQELPGSRVPIQQSPGEKATLDETKSWHRQQAGFQNRQLQQGKVPANYQMNPAGGVIPIPGGPADRSITEKKPLPAEIAARLALGETYAKQLPDLLAAIDQGTTSGVFTRSGMAMGIGKGSLVAARQESGVDALVRNLTGAGKSKEEAKAYASRYSIQANDGVDRQREKVEQLAYELANIDLTLKTQYGQEPSSAYAGIAAPSPLASHPDVDALVQKYTKRP